MKEYRAYVLTREGSIISVQKLRCETKEQAIEQAKALAVSDLAELWDPPNLIGRFKPSP